MSRKITKSAVKGVQWTTLGTFVNAALQIGYASMMSRILNPKVFGVMAMAMILVRLGRYIAQMGMGQTIVQKDDLSMSDIRASFTFSLCISLGLLLFFIALAPLAMLAFNNAEIVPVVRFLSLSLLFSGLGATASGLIRRYLDFKLLAKIEISTNLISYLLVGLPLALYDYGVWSLVWANIAQAAINFLMTFIATKHSLRLTFRFDHFKPIIAFGSRISLIGILEFLGTMIDTMLIGRLIGDRSLGYYNRAQMLTQLPTEHLNNSISKVLFPSLSRIQNQPDKLRKVFLEVVTVMSFLILPLAAGLMTSSEPIVYTVLGKQWSKSISVMQILPLAAAFGYLSHYGGVICDATANLKSKIRLQLLFLVILPALLYLFYKDGLEGIAMALVYAQVFKFMGYQIILVRLLKMQFVSLLRIYLPGLFTGLIVAVSIFCLNTLLSAMNLQEWIIMLIDVALGGSILLFSLRLPFNRNVKYILFFKLRAAFGEKLGNFFPY